MDYVKAIMKCLVVFACGGLLLILAVLLMGCSPIAQRDLLNVTEYCANVCHGQVQSVVFTSPITCICK